MQVARNFFLSTEKTLTRKLYEALLAFKIEHSLTQGPDPRALHQPDLPRPARLRIRRGRADLFRQVARQADSLAEAAMLAGLPKAPSRYNPVANPQRAKQRQQYVLRRMRELGYITDAQYEDAHKAPIGRAKREVNEYSVHAEYVAEMVRQAVYEQYPEDVYTRGFRVYTTIRKADQEAAYAGAAHGRARVRPAPRLSRPGRLRRPAGRRATRTTIEDALADHADSDELLARAGARRQRRSRCKAVLRSGEKRHDLGRGPEVRRARRSSRRRRRSDASAAARSSASPREGQALADRAAARGRGGVRLARPARRRDPRAGRRLRFQPQQVQPRHPGLAPARLRRSSPSSTRPRSRRASRPPRS